MIHSMTGFGRADFVVADVAFAVEMRTVNHRHMDVSVRAPRLLSGLEHRVKRRLAGRFARGKLDVTIALAAGSTPPPRLEIDRQVADQYVAFARDLARDHQLEASLDAASLLSLPGVARLVEAEIPGEELEAALDAALEEAAAQTESMRRLEGEALEREIRARLATVGALVHSLEGRAGEVTEAARERLRKRAEQIQEDTGLLDEARLHQEIVIASDRLDVTEEIVRLASHIDQFQSALDEASPGEPLGRRLDFLLQEMGRETNTIGSKGSDASLAHQVVDLKTELERIREQVQNVE